MAEHCCSSHVDVVKELDWEKEKEHLYSEVARLTKEKALVQERLDFVEELVGPTEQQRKLFQDQLVASRAVTLQAHRNGAPVPCRFLGRLDESWLQSHGLSEHECGLLQRGCYTGQDGVAQDVSLLGDPNFRPYNEKHEPEWEARGGVLHLSLDDVRKRWGEEVALEVVRCSIELDKHDASRRIGVELPWNEAEAREMEPAEVIALLERELNATRCCSSSSSSYGEVAGATLDESSSEIPPSLDSCDLEDGPPSPTWSEFNSRELDDSSFDSSYASTLPLSTSNQYPQRALADIHDEWSLADTDLEHLLHPPLAQARRAQQQKGSEAPRSLLSTPHEGSTEDMNMTMTEEMNTTGWTEADEYCDDFGDDYGEVLRVLEEEVGSSLNRFLAQTPPERN